MESPQSRGQGPVGHWSAGARGRGAEEEPAECRGDEMSRGRVRRGVQKCERNGFITGSLFAAIVIDPQLSPLIAANGT